MSTSRRQLLQVGLTGAAAVALSHSVPGFAAQLATAKQAVGTGLSGDNVLVVVQMSGGNDGLNTVIPFRADEYHRARPHIAIDRGLHRITDDLALNPAMKAFKNLFDQGHLAIINGCGYPEPNRSHFRSLEIWHTAEPTKPASDGWLANYVGQCLGDARNSLAALNVGSYLPQALVSARTDIPSVLSQEDLGAIGYPGTYRPHVMYPAGLGQQLELIARLIDANTGTRVFYCQIGGFDTHANQLSQHAGQLAQLSDSIAAFYKDLAAKGHAGKVTVMCFSEFGRRLLQNNSNGTDHGAAGPMFVVGGKVKGGVYGAYPSLTDLDHGDLKYTTDFRRVYATVLENWLNVRSPLVLKNRFEPMAFL